VCLPYWHGRIIGWVFFTWKWQKDVPNVSGSRQKRPATEAKETYFRGLLYLEVVCEGAKCCAKRRCHMRRMHACVCACGKEEDDALVCEAAKCCAKRRGIELLSHAHTMSLPWASGKRGKRGN